MPALPEEPLDFQQDNLIDPEALHIEVLRQPNLFYRYAKEWVAAKGDVERAKLTLEVFTARKQIEARQFPEKFKLLKATDAAVEFAVKAMPEYKQWAEAYIQTLERMLLCQKAMDAIDDKRAMIEALIELHKTQWFAGPTVPYDLVEGWRAYRDGVKERVEGEQKQHAHKRARREDA